MRRKPTEKQMAVLRAAAEERVTFEEQYRRAGSITIWRLFPASGDEDYDLATEQGKALHRNGLIRKAHASWRHGMGHAELTDEGRRVLAEGSQSDGARTEGDDA